MSSNRRSSFVLDSLPSKIMPKPTENLCAQCAIVDANIRIQNTNTACVCVLAIIAIYADVIKIK